MSIATRRMSRKNAAYAITDFTATGVSTAQINLSWQYDGPELANYTLRRGGEIVATIDGSATSYSDTELMAGFIYTYTLVGNFASGSSTNTVTATGQTEGGSIPKVMPLGDSITDGLAYAGAYRRYLWQSLVIEDGYSFDFVGTQSNGTAELGDWNHEGHSGYRIRDIRDNVDNWFAANMPDVVLLLIGSNDAEQDDDMANAPARLQELIEHMNDLRPGIITILSTATPEAGEPVDIPAFNAELPNMVFDLNANGKITRLVDGYSALTLADLDDGIHPNWTGHQKLAEAFYPQLKAYFEAEI